ncbi:glutathione S-transferase family protein [Acidisphaera sp. L21]|uniref:glutathione S-transferase family protein n=1 Tax=Acidisphaera sp. L21 TaxID=1641851 RepID=UPI00131ACC14|nr:glutathione S-transferase [Acidisphaera sp. L21]
MKIHDREGTINPTRIRIVLAEKRLGDRIEFVSVDIISAEQKSATFLAKNPIGKIPLLELDDGTIISESTAITEYLDNLDGNPTLTGKTPREKALIHMWQRRAEQLLLEPVDDYFHYGTKGLGEALQPFRMPDWAGRKEWGERRGAFAVGNLPYLDTELAGRAFLAGDAFSMADITLFVALAFAELAGLSIPPDLANLATWRGRVANLPAVKNRSGQNLRPEDLARLAA